MVNPNYQENNRRGYKVMSEVCYGLATASLVGGIVAAFYCKSYLNSAIMVGLGGAGSFFLHSLAERLEQNSRSNENSDKRDKSSPLEN